MNETDEYMHSLLSDLEKDSEGIWKSPKTEQISYPSKGNDVFFDFEDQSFWFQHRNRCIKSVALRFSDPRKDIFLDVGGGNGYVTKAFVDLGFKSILLEPGYSGARNARKRGLENVICSSVEDVGFPTASIDALGLFDVLEHIEKPEKFLSSLRTIIKKRGTLYITVPSKQWLWSAEDIDAGHFCRYSRHSLRSVLSSSGFDILYETDLFRGFPIPIFLTRSLPLRFGKVRNSAKISQRAPKEHINRRGFMGRLVRFVLDREKKIISSGKNVKFGSSLMVATRPTR